MKKIATFKIYFKNGTNIEKEVFYDGTDENALDVAKSLKKILDIIKLAFRENVSANIEIYGLHIRLSEVLAVDYKPEV